MPVGALLHGGFAILFNAMRKNLAIAICGIFAIICVGSAIGMYYVKTEPMEIDLMAALVGVLAVLVTVLALFLAVNYIVLEKRIQSNMNEEISEMKRNFEKEIALVKSELNEQINDMNCAVRAYFTYANSGNFIVSSRHGRLMGCLDGLKEEAKSKQKHSLNTIISQFMTLIPILEDREKYLPDGTKKEYLKIIKWTEHPDIEAIYDFVYNLPEEKDLKRNTEKDITPSNATPTE